VQVTVELKEESKAYIANWVPGSGAEEHVCSANVSAVKPLSAPAAPAAAAAAAAAGGCCAPAAAGSKQPAAAKVAGK
jgi:hypothetical protein